jgi:hypothetical protein
MIGWLGLALGQAGHSGEARAVLERLYAIAGDRYVPPSSFAWTHYGLGEIDQAFLWMDRAVDSRDQMIMPIQSYPFLDPIRADSRYVALLRKLNYSTTGVGTCRPPEGQNGSTFWKTISVPVRTGQIESKMVRAFHPSGANEAGFAPGHPDEDDLVDGAALDEVVPNRGVRDGVRPRLDHLADDRAMEVGGDDRFGKRHIDRSMNAGASA